MVKCSRPYPICSRTWVERTDRDTGPQTTGDHDMSNEQELREANLAKNDLADGEQLQFDV